MFTTLSRYLFGLTLRGVAIAATVVLVLILLVDFVEQTRTVDVAVEHYSLLDFARLTLLKTPMLMESTLPFIILFGVMLTMFTLNRRSELIVMRAAGISAWRFIAPPVGIALALGLLSPTLLNPFSTHMTQRFEAALAALTGGADGRQSAGAAWFIESGAGERRLIRAEGVDAIELGLTGATFLFFDAEAGSSETGFVRRVDAQNARYVDGEWVLSGARISAPGEATQAVESMTLPAYLDVATFGQNAAVDTIPFWSLRLAARSATEVGVSPAPYRLRWLRLMASPLVYVAMALIAAAASLRLRRLGGTLRLIVIGGASGFALYFLGDMLDAFALSGRMPLLMAACAAPVVAILAALATIAHFEDS